MMELLEFGTLLLLGLMMIAGLALFGVALLILRRSLPAVEVWIAAGIVGLICSMAVIL